MNERRASVQRPGRRGRGKGARGAPRSTQERANQPPASGPRSDWRSDPRTWTARTWRKAVTQALFVVMAISGLALVAVSAKSLDQALIWGALVMSVVVAMWISRELRLR